MSEFLIDSEGSVDFEVAEIRSNGCVADLVLFARERFGSEEEIYLFLGGDESPLALELLVKEIPDSALIHGHRLRIVEVVVLYNGKHRQRKFAPSATVGRVLAWAVGPGGFNIDPSIRDEMELALEGSESSLPRKDHIGRFVKKPACELRLNLIRGIIPNGSPK